MKRELEKIVTLLTYAGPSKEEIISKAKIENSTFRVYKQNDLTILEVTSKLSFDKKIIDSYFYNINNELIKQVAEIGTKSKVVFDKFEEIQQLLNSNSISHVS